MLGFLLFVLGVLVVGALLFLGASMLLGRGETQPPAELDRSPVELPTTARSPPTTSVRCGSRWPSAATG
jgi:hypothetical protein